jgi:hypothetical protein
LKCACQWQLEAKVPPGGPRAGPVGCQRSSLEGDSSAGRSMALKLDSEPEGARASGASLRSRASRGGAAGALPGPPPAAAASVAVTVAVPGPPPARRPRPERGEGARAMPAALRAPWGRFWLAYEMAGACLPVTGYYALGPGMVPRRFSRGRDEAHIASATSHGIMNIAWSEKDRACVQRDA